MTAKQEKETNFISKEGTSTVTVAPVMRPRLGFKERADLLNRRRVFDYDKKGMDMNNFHYHWANVNGATGSNVEMYEEVGYDICRDKNRDTITRKGQVMGVSQYLMRIPIEEYKAIQKHKLSEVKEIERSIGKKNIKDLPEEHIYGEVTTTPEVIVR